jgi:hypothetical protein
MGATKSRGRGGTRFDIALARGLPRPARPAKSISCSAWLAFRPAVYAKERIWFRSRQPFSRLDANLFGKENAAPLCLPNIANGEEETC